MARLRGLGQGAAEQTPTPLMAQKQAEAPLTPSSLFHVLNAFAEQMGRQEKPIPPGALVQYYSDLASGVLAPEDMKIEDLQFRVRIDPFGNITFQSAPVMLISRYNFALRRVMGFVMDPHFAGAAAALVDFQVREAGRNFDVFKRPVNMQSLLNNVAQPAEWDGVYVTVPGTELEVDWVVDNARWPALVGASKEFGVQLLGDYVACSPVG
jgi:hypothetical protein